jgi:hypothetical protein
MTVQAIKTTTLTRSMPEVDDEAGDDDAESREVQPVW